MRASDPGSTPATTAARDDPIGDSPSTTSVSGRLTPPTTTRINAVRHVLLSTRLAPAFPFQNFESVLPHSHWPSTRDLARVYGHLHVVEWQPQRGWTALAITSTAGRTYEERVRLQDVDPRRSITIVFGRQRNHFCGLAPLGWTKPEQAMGPGPAADHTEVDDQLREWTRGHGMSVWPSTGRGYCAFESVATSMYSVDSARDSDLWCWGDDAARGETRARPPAQETRQERQDRLAAWRRSLPPAGVGETVDVTGSPLPGPMPQRSARAQPRRPARRGAHSGGKRPASQQGHPAPGVQPRRRKRARQHSGDAPSDKTTA